MTKGLTIRIANGSIGTVFVTLLLTALFWFIPPFLLGGNSAEVAFQLMGNQVFAMPMWLSRVLAYFCWLGFWILVNMKCKELTIIPSRSVMVFVLGMAFATFIPQMQRFDHTLVAFMLFVTSFMSIFEFLDSTNQVSQMFRITLTILISSLLAPGNIWLIGVILLGLAYFNAGSWRVFMCMLVALLLVAWMTWGICFTLGKIELVTAWAGSMLLFSLPSFDGNMTQWVGIAALLLAVITVIVALFGLSHTFDARGRLNCSYLRISFFYALALALFLPSAMNAMLMVVLLGATILSALLFSVDKSKFVDTLFFVYIALMILYRAAYELTFPLVLPISLFN